MGSRKSEKPPTHDSSNHTDHSTPQSKAQERLAQVSSHISQSLQPMTREDPPPRRRRRRNSTSQPPADYSDILAQLDTIKRLAATQDTTRSGYVRQKAAGKLWVRERVEQLLDKGSLREVGSAAGEVAWGKTKDAQGRDVDTVEAFTPSNSVQSFGLLGGRKVLLTADDYTLRAGHADGALYEKTLYIEKMALSLRLPILKLVDGSSGGGSVTSIHTNGFSYIPPVPSFAPAVAQLNAGIPNLAAILGPAIGLGAARATMCHFSVMAADVGASFNAGPKVVEGATFEEGLSIQELGGADMHCRNGTVDNVATDEQDAFRQLRTVLGYMPNLGFSAPPVVACDDPIDRREEALLTLIPQRKERMYDPRRVITLTVDKGSWFEIGALWGVSAIVGFARLGGRPVGIISNNCESGTGGAVDAASAQKMGKHLKLCDVMNLPVVQFVDVPGYAVGTAAERSATMRHGVNLALAYYTTTTPVFSVVTRRAYGVAGGVMLDCRDPRHRIAWTSGDWGSLPLSGGIEAGHSAELKAAARQGGEEKARKLYKRLEGEYVGLMNPVRTANAFGVEEIVDPRDTRGVVCAWVEFVYAEAMRVRVMERVVGRLTPVFA